MELLYLWVDDFKMFKNEGFNFSSEFIFESNHHVNNDEQDVVDITVRKNPDYINLFPDDYLNVTCVVGQNASGKTTLFNLIKIFSSDLPNLVSRTTFCYRDRREPNIIHTVYYFSGREKSALNVNIKFSTYEAGSASVLKLKSPVPYTIDYAKGKHMYKEVILEDNPLDTVSTIYFSNVFDTYREDLYDKVANISTNYMVFDSVRDFLKDFKPSRDINTNILNQVNPLIDFFDSELKSQIAYITYAQKHDLIDIPLPEYLMIGFSKDDFVYLSENLKNSYLFQQEDLNQIDRRAMEFIQSTGDPVQRFLYIIYLLAFYYAIRVDLFQQTENVGTNIMPKRIHDIAKAKDVIGAIRVFIRETKPFDEHKTINHLRALYGSELEKKLKTFGLEADSNNPFRFRFPITSKLWEILDIILNVQYLGDKPFLNYSWYGISSGQEAYLRQFSRFYWIRDQVANSTFWILIDEGELYFHPEWQKEYIQRIIDFLPKIFRGTKIQLFLSSHSPFVVSDLPKSNIIFRSKDKNMKFDIKETLGSNIHTLFTNSFFLSSLMGDFAKAKIDEAINYLNGKPQKQFKTDDEVQKFIRIVGEPILRNQLQLMLDSNKLNRIQTDVLQLKKRIVKLETPKKRKKK